MSVLINGMEMPEHCGECKLKAEYDDETFCPWFADNVEYWIAAGRRHEECPLGPVPPHGDLIDVEAFLATQREMYCENCERRKGMKNGKMRFVYDVGDAPCRACDIRDVLYALEDAPTIIPAEKEGER